MTGSTPVPCRRPHSAYGHVGMTTDLHRTFENIFNVFHKGDRDLTWRDFVVGMAVRSVQQPYSKSTMLFRKLWDQSPAMMCGSGIPTQSARLSKGKEFRHRTNELCNLNHV